MSDAAQGGNGEGNRRRIQFVKTAAASDTVLVEFRDPAPGFAVLGAEVGAGGDGLDVVLLPAGAAGQGEQRLDAGEGAVLVKYRGVEVAWRPGQATLQCEPEQANALLAGLAEFAHYERELRRLEDEVADGWPELEQDKRLAYEVSAADLKRVAVVGERVERTLSQRIRYARIEPHLYEPDAALTPAGQKLGAELRGKARIESRLETADGQLEVFETVYEMASQRMGEYRASREEHTLEWIIIVLLAVETFLLLGQVFLRK